jgi:hypothetical protein
MSGDHLEIGVNQNWNIEAKALYAACDLTNLFWPVQTRIIGIERWV